MNDCPHCGTPNAPSRHYCRNCGRQLVVFCSRCGFGNEIEAHYCGGCGTSLAAKNSAELASLEVESGPVMPESGGGLSCEELDQLKKINERRRQTLAIAGPRKTLSQEDLDKLFGTETR